MTETMPAEVIDNLVDFCESRSSMYTLLSRCFEKEMDAAFAQALAETHFESGDPALTTLFTTMKTKLEGCNADTLEELAVVFDRVFFGMGPRTAQKAFPYESVYTSEGGLMMQDAYSEVLHTYRDAGFEKAPGFTEPEDHVAVELAFMAKLCEQAAEALRAGDEEKAEALIVSQQAFLTAHLLNWTPAFFSEVQAAAEGGFYTQLGLFALAYLQADNDALAEVLA